LQTIHDVAKKELGPALESAVVSTWSDPEEEDSDILLLSMDAKADRQELKRVQDVIFSEIAKEAINWTDQEKKDYSERIYFDLEWVDG